MWKQHDLNVKSFYFSQARNAEIGRRSSCSSAYRRSIFGSSAVHKMECDSHVCSAPNCCPKRNQLLDHHCTDPPCPEKANGNRNLLPLLSLVLQSWQSWYLQYRPGQAALTTLLVAFNKVLNFNYFLCCANIGDTAVPNPNIYRAEVWNNPSVCLPHQQFLCRCEQCRSALPGECLHKFCRKQEQEQNTHALYISISI